MFRQELFLSEAGFTLIEIIGVMVILGVLATVAVPRYVDLGKNARRKGIDKVISEINAREVLTWADDKISASGFVSDAKIFGEIDYALGPNQSWHAGDPTVAGGTIAFKDEPCPLSRSPSTALKWAVWKRK